MGGEQVAVCPKLAQSTMFENSSASVAFPPKCLLIYFEKVCVSREGAEKEGKRES